MGKEAVTRWCCDLCKREEIARTLPSAWVEFSREHPMLDRSFIEHVICGDCADPVAQAVGERGS